MYAYSYYHRGKVKCDQPLPMSNKVLCSLSRCFSFFLSSCPPPPPSSDAGVKRTLDGDALVCTHARTSAHTNARTHAQMHACTRARAHAHMRTRTHARMHARTHARMHACTHARTYNPVPAAQHADAKERQARAKAPRAAAEFFQGQLATKCTMQNN